MKEILPFIILVLTLFLLCLCGHLFTKFFMIENFINEINSEDDLFEILISEKISRKNALHLLKSKRGKLYPEIKITELWIQEYFGEEFLSIPKSFEEHFWDKNPPEKINEEDLHDIYEKLQKIERIYQEFKNSSSKETFLKYLINEKKDPDNLNFQNQFYTENQNQNQNNFINYSPHVDQNNYSLHYPNINQNEENLYENQNFL
jgi:hypothetical protein